MFGLVKAATAMGRRIKETTIKYGPWPGGKTTERKHQLADKSELPDATNFVIIDKGSVRTRDGTTKLALDADGSVENIRDVRIGGTWNTMIADKNGANHKVYAGKIASRAWTYSIDETADDVGTYWDALDYTAFTATDVLADRLTVDSSTQLTIVNLDNDEDVFLTKDLGAGNVLDGDFKRRVSFDMSGASDGDMLCVWGLHGDDGVKINDSSGGLHLLRPLQITMWRTGTNDVFYISDMATEDYSTSLTWTTQYYVEIIRSGSTITATAYSDATYSTAVVSIDITQSTPQSYRYEYGMSGLTGDGTAPPESTATGTTASGIIYGIYDQTIVSAANILIGSDGGSADGYFRFNKINLPQGFATISSATLTLYPTGAETGTLDYDIYGIDADNATMPTTTIGLEALTETTAKVDWAPAGHADGVAEVSGDIKAILHEICGRSGWVEGNDLIIKVKNMAATGNYATYYDYTGDSTKVAVLTITFTHPTVAVSTKVQTPDANDYYEGDVHFFGFNEKLIICDGSYLKEWDGNIANEATLLYDDGTGPDAHQFDTRVESDDTYLALGNGTNTRVGYKFTTQSWDTGYTITPTVVFARISKNGTGGSGAITAKVRLVSSGSVYAEKVIVADVTKLSTTAVLYDATFASGTGMTPSTAYYLTIEYAGGDAANYVKLHCTTVSGGTVGYYHDGAWKLDATKAPIMAVNPGRPPKAVFGLVHDRKIFCIEGETGTNSSYVWYCATGNQYDWSTRDGGGYVPAIDVGATNYPIGSIASYLEDLWVFGTKRQPYLGKLSGVSPDNYEITETRDRVAGHYKSLVTGPTGLWFLHPSGVDVIAPTDKYGDVVQENRTDKIKRTIHANYSTAAFAGYDPEWGLYFLKLAGYTNTIVVHTRMKTVQNQGQQQIGIAPITEFDFAFSDGEVPTAFGIGNGYLLIGTDGGNVYKMDVSVVADDFNDVTYDLKTNSEATRFDEAEASAVAPLVTGESGASFVIDYYKDNSGTALGSTTITLPFDGEASEINFNFRTLRLGIDTVSPNGGPLYIGNLVVKVNSVGGL